MHVRPQMIVLLLVASSLALGCSDDDGQPDSGITDSQVGDSAPDPDGDIDAGPCNNEGELNDPCTTDCDCQTDLACRGLPGEKICAVPCESYDACGDALPGCTMTTCDLAVGACRCPCETGACGDEVCFAGYCVGCAQDADCTNLACGTDPGLDTGVCELATETCQCGGQCGDNVCDPVEAAQQDCPADCPAPCDEGAILPVSCSSGARHPWCNCVGGAWSCGDPWANCIGDTRCAQEGGFCVAQEADCFAGTIDASDLGCEGDTPLCCTPEPCTEAGSTYYPGSGRCCLGLRAITSLAPMSGMFPAPDDDKVTCFPGCWAMTCAPCGDGACQLHFGENFCNCPEDCPLPPYELFCDPQDPTGCGRSFCRQDGLSCHQETPRCETGQCVRDVEDVPFAYCNPITDACE